MVAVFNGRMLKERRKLYGVSQNKLAIVSGISREYLVRIEQGKRFLHTI